MIRLCRCGCGTPLPEQARGRPFVWAPGHNPNIPQPKQPKTVFPVPPMPCGCGCGMMLPEQKVGPVKKYLSEHRSHFSRDSRRRAKERGFCPQCMTRRPPPGYIVCDVCRADETARRVKRAPLVRYCECGCGKVVPKHYRFTPECRRRHEAEYRTAKYRLLREAGLCIVCRRPAGEVEYCDDCWQAHCARFRPPALRPRACSICNTPGHRRERCPKRERPTV